MEDKKSFFSGINKMTGWAKSRVSHSSFLIPYTTLILLLLVAGCGKESDDGIPASAFCLSTENFASHDGTKTSVLENSVVWENGDKVKLNGDEYTVNVAGGQAYVTGFTVPSNDFLGIYPSSLTATATTFTMPNQFESHYSGGRQVIQLPMAAMGAANATSVQFLHLSAATRVLDKNTTGYDVVLDKVVLSSKDVQLCGSRGFTAGVGTLSVDAQGEGAVAADDTTVTVVFTDSPVIATGGSDIKEVQVPMLPIGTGNITIAVYTHIVGTPKGAACYTFRHRASNPALGRNQMMTARIEIKASGDHMVETPKGIFSVSADKKVFFSQGNLQYTGSWQFATNQYDFFGTSQSDNHRDLFGWGTGNDPNKVSTTDGDYSSFNEWGTSPWRTLSAAEWGYLLTSRSGNRYIKATINDQYNGLLIFPDGYSHPADLPELEYVNNAGTGYTYSITTTQWNTLQSLGVVFLPTAGYRDGSGIPESVGGQGVYWSSTNEGTTKAKRLLFSASELETNNATGRHLGYSVRLVREL